jgi:hypothetical protein
LAVLGVKNNRSDWISVATMLALALPAFGQLTVGGYNHVSATLGADGAWSVLIPATGWKIGGSVGLTAYATTINAGADKLGPYQELAFSYNVSTSSRNASIRVYTNRPLVLFSITYNNDSPNVSPFPAVTTYPRIFHLSFNGQFSPPDFVNLENDSPWVFFDGAANAFILSAASDYMTAATVRQADNSITAGISSRIAILPAGFSHRTALVYGQGINQTFANWGQTLTDLSGKQRPANDADALLKSVSYWTDNTATYYYNPGGPSYTGTLESIKAEFDAMGIGLGSLQLDSWWYPKGPDNSWSSHSGIWTYTAAPALFQPDLETFQAALGVPLITHARWIDPNSPYRTKYLMSGDVATDPQYWEDIATYLQSSGVVTYEQDWLGANAKTSFNLTDPYAFLGNMAASMARRGMTLQYCMGTPAHFMQSTSYNNVTTIRASQDGFRKANWTNFLYSSRFVAAIGAWPFADVFMSSQTSNLIAAALSAGPIGVGDAVGSLSKENLLKALRRDGVIVKPDVPATPLDSIFINDAQGIDVPMVAAAYSEYGGGLRTYYILAYTRAANGTIRIDPSAYGMAGSAYLYDWLGGAGHLINAGSSYTLDLANGFGYFVLSPIGQTGIALIGDKDQFVTLGKKRVPALTDNGRIDLTVSFAPGETERTLSGYSPTPVRARAVAGSASAPVWDPSTQLFTVKVMPAGGAGTAEVRIRGRGSRLRR